jgi:hypothetical protein
MASASLAAALFAAFLLWPDSGDAITVENVSARVKGWNASLAPDARHWHVKSTPAEYPLSSGVILPPPVRWQRLSNTASGERVVCYDLAGPGQSDVRLFVVLVTRTARLNASPPAKPLSDSQGVQVAAWQEWRQGRCVVYALVVDGSTSAYENLVRHRRRFASAALPLSPSA